MVCIVALFGTIGSGCKGSPTPTGPSAAGTPGTILLWSGGSAAGTWFGSAVADIGLFNGGASACTALSVAVVTDAYSGDSSVQDWLASNGGGSSCAGSGPWNYSFGVYAPTLGAHNAEAYRSGGNLRFDLQLGPVAPSAISVSIGNATPSTITASVALTPGNYPSATFYQVVLPISSFSPDVTASMNMPFLITFSMASPPAQSAILGYVDNIRWTAN
jgi:hypothetical protein